MGTNVVLSWPQSGSNYVLESSAVLPNVGGWTQEAQAPTLAGGHLWLTNTTQAEARFYRLRSECSP